MKNKYYRLTGNFERIARILIKNRVAFNYDALFEGIEFVLTEYDPKIEELTKAIGAKNMVIHSTFETDKNTIYSMYHG